jgi:hypothetical protein
MGDFLRLVNGPGANRVLRADPNYVQLPTTRVEAGPDKLIGAGSYDYVETRNFVDRNIVRTAIRYDRAEFSDRRSELGLTRGW